MVRNADILKGKGNLCVNWFIKEEEKELVVSVVQLVVLLFNLLAMCAPILSACIDLTMSVTRRFPADTPVVESVVKTAACHACTRDVPQMVTG